MGVNDSGLTKDHLVISNGSCTTNCLAPVAKVLNDAFGIVNGYMTTVHSYTGDQPTLDTMHKDLYRARAAALSMIPTSTGAAKAIGLVIPELKGKLDGAAIRVPTPNVSVVDFKFLPKTPVTAEEVNKALIAAAAKGPLKGILEVTDQPLVSTDFNHNQASSTVALDQTKVLEGKLVRVLSGMTTSGASRTHGRCLRRARQADLTGSRIADMSLDARALAFWVKVRGKQPEILKRAGRALKALFLHHEHAPAIPDELLADCMVLGSRASLIAQLPRHGIVAEVGVETAAFSKVILETSATAGLHMIDLDFTKADKAVLERPQVTRHEGRSDAILASFDEASFDWIYIDADHSYAGVRADAAAAKDKLKPGGFLVFNDFALIDVHLGRYGVHRASPSSS